MKDFLWIILPISHPKTKMSACLVITERRNWWRRSRSCNYNCSSTKVWRRCWKKRQKTWKRCMKMKRIDKLIYIKIKPIYTGKSATIRSSSSWIWKNTTANSRRTTLKSTLSWRSWEKAQWRARNKCSRF